MKFQKGARITGYISLLLFVVLGGMAQTAALGQAGINHVDVDFYTYISMKHAKSRAYRISH